MLTSRSALMPGSACGEEPHGLLAIAASIVVLAGGVRVADHRVADDQPHLRVDRHEPPVEAAAIEEKRVAGRAVTGDELVHDAAAHADEFVLGPLAGQRQRRQVDLYAGGTEKSVADRRPPARPMS